MPHTELMKTRCYSSCPAVGYWHMMDKPNGQGQLWKGLTLPNVGGLKYIYFFPILSGDGGKEPKPSPNSKCSCRVLLGKWSGFSGRDLARRGGSWSADFGAGSPEAACEPCSRASSPTAFGHGTRHLTESPGDVDIGSMSKRSENLAGLCPDDINFGRTSQESKSCWGESKCLQICNCRGRRNSFCRRVFWLLCKSLRCPSPIRYLVNVSWLSLERQQQLQSCRLVPSRMFLPPRAAGGFLL